MAEPRVIKASGYRVTCKFGPRIHPVTGKKSNHNGVDLVASPAVSNPHIIAHTAGTVKTSSYNSTIGYYVEVQVSPTCYMQYCHMKQGSVTVKTGDTVKQGQKIGVMGTTGLSTGVHLHFGINESGSWIDPEAYISKDYLEEEEMTQEEFNRMLDKALEEKANSAPPTYAEAQEAMAWAVQKGLFKGSNTGMEWNGLMSRVTTAILMKRLCDNGKIQI